MSVSNIINDFWSAKTGRTVIFDPSKDGDRPALQKDIDGIIDTSEVNIRIDNPCDFGLEKNNEYQELSEYSLKRINQEYSLNFPQGSVIQFQPYTLVWKIYSSHGELKELKELKELIEESNEIFLNTPAIETNFWTQSPFPEIRKNQLDALDRKLISKYNWNTSQLDLFKDFSYDNFKNNLKQANKRIWDLSWFHLSRKLPLSVITEIVENEELRSLLVIKEFFQRCDLANLEGILIMISLDHVIPSNLIIEKIYVNDSQFISLIENLLFSEINTSDLQKKINFKALLNYYLEKSKSNFIPEHVFNKILEIDSKVVELVYTSPWAMKYSDETFQKMESKELDFWCKYSKSIEDFRQSNDITEKEKIEFIKKFEMKYDFFSLTENNITLEILDLFYENFSHLHWESFSSNGILSFEIIEKYCDKLNLDSVWKNVQFIGLSSENEKHKEYYENELIDFMLKHYQELDKKHDFLEYFNEDNVQKWANKLFFEKDIDYLPNVDITKYIDVEVTYENFIDF